MWGSQEEKVPFARKVKKSAYINIWGAMSPSGLSKLHIIPAGQTVTAEYYETQILEKEVKPLINSKKSENID